MASSNENELKIKQARYNSALKYVKAILKNANSEDPGEFIGQRLATFDQVYEDHLASFGYNLRKIRLIRGFSTRDLGMLTGLGSARIGQLENGRQGFGNVTISKLADALDAYACVVFVDKETVHEVLGRKPRSREPKLFENENGELKYSNKYKAPDEPLKDGN